jgi:DNA polymerase-4
MVGRFAAGVQRRIGATGEAETGTLPAGMKAERTILHVDMDAFFASVEQRDRPELRGRPVVVGAPPDKRGVVAAASYEARKFGIHSAMPSRTAFRLCPHAVFVRGDHAKYSRESERIMAILRDYTPLVEPVSVDEAWLDVTASLASGLFRSGESIAREIKRRIRETIGLTASVGVAPNKFLAKLASDMQKPDGLTVITEANKLDILRPMPVGRIPGIGPKTEPRLRAMGIRTIGDLQRLPPPTLRARFGAWAEALHHLALGEDDRPVEPRTETKSLSGETTFERDVRDPAKLERVLRELAEEVAQRLRAEGFRARTVQLKLRWSDFATLTRRVTLAEATDDAVALADAARALLRREWRGDRAVRLLGMGGQNLVRGPVQADLFDARAAKRARLNVAADALRAKLGQDKLKSGDLL